MSSLFSVMQKFEKAPEWKVNFSAAAPGMVRSKVPGSDSPLMQCLAGEGHWGNKHRGNGVETSCADAGETQESILLKPQ